MAASVKEAMKYGPPRSPKLREQIVSATNNAAPSMYTLDSELIFTAFSTWSVIVPSPAPIL